MGINDEECGLMFEIEKLIICYQEDQIIKEE